MATSPPDRSDDEGPSLRQIARQLTTPVLAGCVLTRERISQLAARLSVPAGMAERSQMLVNAMQAAAEMDRLPGLLEALVGEVDRWERTYADWTERYPSSAPIWAEWRARLESSRALLAGMRAALDEVVAIQPPDPEATPRPGDLETAYDD